MALTPEYLQKCSDEIDQIFWKLGTRILMDIADRIRHAGGMTSTTEYLNEKLRVLGLQQTAINEMLAEALNTEKTAVDKLMEESTAKSTRQMFDNLEAAGYDTSGLEFRDQILKSTNVLNNELTNLTRTTAQLGSVKMMDALDQAYLQVSSGAYSFDEAVANACQKLAREGLDKVEYPSGAHRTVEAAVRVAVRTSVNQNALQCEMDAIKKMGINLVETSSHLGARPTHAVWQGKVFWLNTEDPRYENFYEATGYGTATGLGGYNCRHSFYPYFEELGEQTYEHFDEEKNREYYEQEQKQRYLERKVREWDRREQILKAGSQDTTEATRWKKYYKDQLNSLVKSSNGFLKRDYAAEKAYATPRTALSAKKAIASPKQISASAATESPKSESEYEAFTKEQLTGIRSHDRLSKEQWISELKSMGFAREYKIAHTPDELKQFGADEDIVMSISNFAYILQRHSDEFIPEIYSKAKETIEDYDLLLHGTHKGMVDFRFFKLFKDEKGLAYGIDIVIDKPEGSEKEFVVHLDYYGRKRNRGIKRYKDLQQSENLINQKN